MTSSIRMVVVQAELEEGAMREAIGTLREALGATFPARPISMPQADTALASANGHAALLPAPTTDLTPTEGNKPRRKYGRQKKAVSAVSAVERPKRTYTRRQPAAAAGEPGNGKQSLADRIASLLSRYGKLSQQKLASLTAASERAVGLAIGHAKGRFVWDEQDEAWSLAEESQAAAAEASPSESQSAEAHPLEERLANLIRETGPKSAGDAARMLKSHHKTIYACVEATQQFELDTNNRICLAE